MPDHWKLLDEAIQFAVEKHAGQVDKSGRPYILHPLRVMQSFEDPLEKIVAVLHDVLEDCDVTKHEIFEKFGTGVFLHVDYLTKLKSQSLDEYLDGIKLYDISTRVKIKDIEDNMSPFRLQMLDEKTAQRLIKKYHYCLNRLME